MPKRRRTFVMEALMRPSKRGDQNATELLVFRPVRMRRGCSRSQPVRHPLGDPLVNSGKDLGVGVGVIELDQLGAA